MNLFERDEVLNEQLYEMQDELLAEEIDMDRDALNHPPHPDDEWGDDIPF